METWRLVFAAATKIIDFVSTLLGFRRSLGELSDVKNSRTAERDAPGQENIFHNVSGSVNITKEGDIVMRGDGTEKSPGRGLHP